MSRIKDQYTVVLEDLRSQFKGFGEGLKIVDAKVDRVVKKVDQLEVDMQMVKDELALIRHNQVTRDEFKLLETRVQRLEKLASHR
jgi:hypothetical protein